VTIENAIGGSARDLIWGNSSANKLEGRGGNDVINGFGGADQLCCGEGNDTFAFSVVDKLSKIMDWNAGDKIDLTKIDAITGGADNAFSWIGATSSPRWRASSVTRTACSRVT
jgi:serralysin